MLIWVAAGFFTLAVLLVLVWPLLVVPTGHRMEAMRSPAARAMAGGAATVVLGALAAPLLAAALISGTDTVQFVAYEFGNLSFGM